MHIPEDKIEILIFSPDLLGESEKVLLHAHINECKLCKEIYDETNNIHKDIIAKINNPPAKLDEEFAAKLYYANKEKRKLLPQSNNAVEIFEGKTQIIEVRKPFSIQNIFYFVRKHPVASGGFVFVGMLALAFIFTTFKGIVKDYNPVYAEIKSGILEVYNSGGEILWKKTVGDLPDTKHNKPKYDGYEKRYLSVLEITVIIKTRY